MLYSEWNIRLKMIEIVWDYLFVLTGSSAQIITWSWLDPCGGTGWLKVWVRSKLFPIQVLGLDYDMVAFALSMAKTLNIFQDSLRRSIKSKKKNFKMLQPAFDSKWKSTVSRYSLSLYSQKLNLAVADLIGYTMNSKICCATQYNLYLMEIYCK